MENKIKLYSVYIEMLHCFTIELIIVALDIFKIIDIPVINDNNAPLFIFMPASFAIGVCFGYKLGIDNQN